MSKEAQEPKSPEIQASEAALNNAKAAREAAETRACEQESAANVAKLLAETGRAHAERGRIELDLASAKIDFENKRREQREKLSANKYHHIYHFMDEVNGPSVQNCMNQLDIWRRSTDQKEFDIIFTSPGGSILAGLVLYDYIQSLKAQDYVINTGTYGMAASMAGILLQAGTKRWMGREAWVLIHEASFMTMGKIGEVEDTVNWIKRIGDRILDIFAHRAAGVLTKAEPDSTAYKTQFKATRKQIVAEWKRKDWWISSDECMKAGFVDEVR